MDTVSEAPERQIGDAVVPGRQGSNPYITLWNHRYPVAALALGVAYFRGNSAIAKVCKGFGGAFLFISVGADLLGRVFSAVGNPTSSPKARPSDKATPEVIRSWPRKALAPPQIREVLDRRLVGHAKAKDVFSVLGSQSWPLIEPPQQQRALNPVVLYGPAGSGKRELVASLAEAMDVSLLVVDAAKSVNEDSFSRLLRGAYMKHLRRAVAWLETRPTAPGQRQDILSRARQPVVHVINVSEGGKHFLRELEAFVARPMVFDFVRAGSGIRPPLMVISGEFTTLNRVKWLESSGGSRKRLARPEELEQRLTSHDFKVVFSSPMVASVQQWVGLKRRSAREWTKILQESLLPPVQADLADRLRAKVTLSERAQRTLIAATRRSGSGVRGLQQAMATLMAPVEAAGASEELRDVEIDARQVADALGIELGDNAGQTGGEEGDAAAAIDITAPGIKAVLDEAVIGQEKAKKMLAVAISHHLTHCKKSQAQGADSKPLPHLGQNVLLMGPTGSGKTLLLRQLTKKYGIPFVVADASQLSPSGIFGRSVSDVVRDLLAAAGQDVKRAQRGIIYFDEFDKLAGGSGSRFAPLKQAVQAELLKLLDHGTVSLRGTDHSERRGSAPEELDTSNVLFIFGGAFAGIEELIERRWAQEKRVNTQADALGLRDRRDLHALIAPKDLIAYGLLPELVGRLTLRAPLERLSTDQLVTILKESSGSVLKRYQDLFEVHDVDLQLTDEACERIAQYAADQNLGARALEGAMEEVLGGYRFDISELAGQGLTITGEQVGETLDALPSSDADLRKREVRAAEKEKNRDISPKGIKAVLDRSVIGQERAKQRLAIGFSHHLTIGRAGDNAEELENLDLRSHMLLMGPSGSGKSFMLSRLAEEYGVPFVTVDASRLSPTGYVGPSVNDALQQLVAAAKGNIAQAERGIVFFDEFDKLARSGRGSVDGFRRAAQAELLKLLDGGEVQLPAAQGNGETWPLDTSKILFVFGGAFSGIEKVVAGRLVDEGKLRTKRAYRAKVNDSKVYGDVTPRDLIDYGVMRELVGRIGIRAPLERLSVADLVRVLKDTDRSVLKRHQKYFAMHQVALTFDDEAIETIAQAAAKLNLGARALGGVLDELLEPFRMNLEEFRGGVLHFDGPRVRTALNLPQLRAKVPPEDPGTIRLPF